MYMHMHTHVVIEGELVMSTAPAESSAGDGAAFEGMEYTEVSYDWHSSHVTWHVESCDMSIHHMTYSISRVQCHHVYSMYICHTVQCNNFIDFLLI